MAISRITWVSRNQNVSILDFIGAEDDGGVGDNWSNKTCSSQNVTTNISSPKYFYRPDAIFVAQPTMSEHWMESWCQTNDVKEQKTFHDIHIWPKFIWNYLVFNWPLKTLGT